VECDDQDLRKSTIINSIWQVYEQFHCKIMGEKTLRNLSRAHKLYTAQKLLKYSDATTFWGTRTVNCVTSLKVTNLSHFRHVQDGQSIRRHLPAFPNQENWCHFPVLSAQGETAPCINWSYKLKESKHKSDEWREPSRSTIYRKQHGLVQFRYSI
jgi:hypothetical protein